MRMISRNKTDLYSLLANTTKSHPDKEAVICGRVRYSYTQFKERVDRLSSGLQSLGIAGKDKIAVIHTNCHRYLEIYFAAAKIRAVLVPVNYRLAAQDFIFILNDAHVCALIADPELIPSLEGKTGEMPRLQNIILTSPAKAGHWQDSIDYDALFQGKVQTNDVPSDLSDSSIAQIYYTSGTTGRPKGVILTHRNNRFHARSAIQELELSEQDRWLHVSPMFHLADAWAVWAITEAAGTHVMIPCFEPKAVLDAIEKHKVTLSNFIPTMLNFLVNRQDIAEYDLSSLRLVMSGGAPIAKAVVRRVTEIFRCDYIQTYGLTETSPFLTMSILTKDLKRLPFEERLKCMVTTGRPFRDVRIRVIKEDGTDVLPDDRDVGEILAKGETITPGYWNQPEETARRIVDGWLYTRDLAVVNSDGYLTIVDRKDDVILTGGENVYSIEVEDTLYSHPDILEAAVIGLPDPLWGEVVAAAVVAKPDRRLREEEVIRFCKERLAHFKAPKKVFFTDHLPMTGSAKIYKYRLREEYKPK